MKTLYFFIGTQAELMKLFKVINKAKEKGFACKIISTGQNDLKSCPYLELSQSVIDIDILANKVGEKNVLGYFEWFLKTAGNGKKILMNYFTEEHRKEGLCVVHGDTLTTTMGAWICKKLKLPYVHIESGPRSYNFLSPFPEEFDRLFGSTYSVINFCPGEIHAEYAKKKFKGQAINTVYNTGIETLYDALERNGNTRHEQQPKEKYFMFMLHRQENIMNKSFVKQIVNQILKMANEMTCVFIFHQQTKKKMEEYKLFHLFEEHTNIIILPRQEYFDFIKLVCYAEFIATDGCGNQQEFFYLGKPYLILRTSVEKNTEGLNWNAKVFGKDFNRMDKFLDEYLDYIKPRVIPEVSPCEIIVNSFEKWYEEREK